MLIYLVIGQLLGLTMHFLTIKQFSIIQDLRDYSSLIYPILCLISWLPESIITENISSAFGIAQSLSA